jgi:uncharacterized membrane protein
MTDAQAETDGVHADVERNLGLLAYGLMFFAIFLSGLPALIAVIIAYARRKQCGGALANSHYSFLIWIFWVGCGLALLTAAAGMATVFSALIQLIGNSGPEVLDSWANFQSRLAGSSSVALFLISTAVLFVLTGLWLAGASTYGFIRLASSLPMSETTTPIRR